MRIGRGIFIVAALGSAACQCGDTTAQSLPSAVFSPSPLALGSAELGVAKSAYLELRNPGGAALTIESLKLVAPVDAPDTDLRDFEIESAFEKTCTGSARGGLADDGIPVFLSPSDCARAVVTFKTFQVGLQRVEVELTSDAEQGPVRVAVTATGVSSEFRACVLDADGLEPEGSCSDVRATEPVFPTIDFGAVPRGTTVTRTLRVHNDGAGTLRGSLVEVVPGTAPFTVSDTTIPPRPTDDSYDLTLSFTPVAAGPVSAGLDIETNDPLAAHVTFPLAGTGLVPELRACAGEVCTDRAAVTVPTIDFGLVPLGQSVERTLQLDNLGGAVLNVTGGTLDPASGDLAIPGGLSAGALEPGAGTTVRVTYVPSTLGPATATITLHSDDDVFGTLVVPVRGTGGGPQVRACVLTPTGTEDASQCTDFTVDPPVVPEVVFGGVVLGATNRRTVRLSNLGDTPLNIGETLLSNASVDFTLEVPGTGLLSPGAATDAVLAFHPLTEPEQTAAFVIRSDSLVRPLLSLNLRGSGIGPKLCVEPAGGIDFGSVNMGLNRVLPFTIRNCGVLPLSVDTVRLDETDGTAGDFAFVTAPSLPLALASGATANVDVRYSPRATRTDTGSVTFIANGLTETRTLRGVGAPSTCQTAPPTANAGVDQTVRPQATVTLDGRASTSPRSGALTYTWRLVSQPTNGRDALNATSGAQPTITTNLAGDYVVELVVRDSGNCQSAADTVTIHVVPPTKVHVQLTWAESHGDVDLHYVGPGGAFRNSGDVYFGNKTPDWGLNNTVAADGVSSNNATLDRDEVWGNGPENLNHNIPFDGTYKVIVHGYCTRFCFLFFCDSSSGSITPTIKVFLNGVQAWSHTFPTMLQRDQWYAGDVVVSGGGTSVRFVPKLVDQSDSSSSASCTSDTD